MEDPPLKAETAGGKRLDRLDKVDGKIALRKTQLSKPPLDFPLKLEAGCTIYCRYLDHALYRGIDPNRASPFPLECVGWLHSEDADCIRIVNERFSLPDPPRQARPPDKCLVILKSTIVELRRLS
jgi:hypothetical protein